MSADGPTNPSHSYRITEPTRVPWPGLLLGYAAMLPLMLGAAGVWLLPPEGAALMETLMSVWGGAIVTFLAGVRRGLSFRAPDGATLPQIVTMLWLFALGFVALCLSPGRSATGLLLAGYLSLAVFDTMAARREEAPPYFARLRPPQMTLALLSLAALLVRQIG